MITRMNGVLPRDQVIDYLCEYISILQSEIFELKDKVRDLEAKVKFGKPVEQKEDKQ